MRMPIAVVPAAGNDRIVRIDRCEKRVAGRSGAAVMPRLQHVRLKRKAAFHHGLFRIAFCIAAKDKGTGAVNQPYPYGQVVEISAFRRLSGNILRRRQDGKGCVFDGINVSRMRNRYRQILFQQRVKHVFPGLCSVGHIRHDDRADFKGADHIVQSADMILVRMGPDQIIQLCYVQRAEVSGYNAPALISSRIYQHGPISGLDENGITLPHIDEMHPEISIRIGRSCRCGARCFGFAVFRHGNSRLRLRTGPDV